MPIAISKTDGSVDIVYPVTDTEQQALETWQANNPGLYVEHVSIEAANLPPSRQYRNAWVLTGGQVVVDATKVPATVEPLPPVQEQLDALRKAVLDGDKTDLAAVDSEIAAASVQVSPPIKVIS